MSRPRRVLVTGGAGFVGASLAVALKQRHPDQEIIALDNLRRRGSELNLARLKKANVRFVHGDVRNAADLNHLPRIDALVECSAEPSALAGSADGATDYPVRTNLLGAWHCLELARRDQAHVVFLSTSRVYPIKPLQQLAIEQTPTRFTLNPEQPTPGASEHGIAEDFPLTGARTLYGATKLAAELLIEEYRAAFGLTTTINRCGVIAGPWQMGNAEQGVFAHWVLAHLRSEPLRYIGYEGRQVRDLLHVDDLVDLLDDQLARPEHWDGATFNVGGGAENSLSLRRSDRAGPARHRQRGRRHNEHGHQARRHPGLHLRLPPPPRPHGLAPVARARADARRHRRLGPAPKLAARCPRRSSPGLAGWSARSRSSTSPGSAGP